MSIATARKRKEILFFFKKKELTRVSCVYCNVTKVPRTMKGKKRTKGNENRRCMCVLRAIRVCPGRDWQLHEPGCIIAGAGPQKATWYLASWLVCFLSAALMCSLPSPACQTTIRIQRFRRDPGQASLLPRPVLAEGKKAHPPAAGSSEDKQKLRRI